MYFDSWSYVYHSYVFWKKSNKEYNKFMNSHVWFNTIIFYIKLCIIG